MDIHDPIDLYLLQQIIQNDEEAEPSVRRSFFWNNPFDDMTDVQFIRVFRLNKNLVRELIELVSPFMVHPVRKSGLSVSRKVLVALRFYAQGSYQEITGSNVYTAVSQSTVSKCVKEVTTALNNREILNTYIHFPNNMQELNDLRNRFYAKYEFPGIVGCIDCTHVAIVTPPANNNEHPPNIYINRKSFHSINVQLVCDENLKIININAKCPGSSHDSFIWNLSTISGTMEAIHRRYPDNTFFLIGDSGYPLRPWLLTPISQPAPDSPEERFNQRFSDIRNTIERCNGVLKNRFRCLLRHRVLHYTPEVASKIINACAILHNICIDNNIEEPEIVEDLNDWGIFEVENFVEGRNLHPDLLRARNIRAQLVRNYFN